MSTFHVYAFNEAYEIANIITGIQHFLNSSTFQGMLIMALMIALLIGALGFIKKAHTPYWAIMGFFAPLVMFLALVVPKAKINITDMYSGEVYTVSNIPIGLAFPLSVSSHIEWGLTKIIDDNVRPVSSPSFTEMDFMGHSRMMEHVSNSNNYLVPHITRSLVAYGRDCMLPALASGTITYTDIQTSGNLANKLNINFLALFTTIYDLNGNRSIQPCGVAYPYILGEINGIVNMVSNTPFRQQTFSVFGRKAAQPALAAAALHTGVNSMFSGFQGSADQLFQQMFIINGIRSTISTVDPTLGLAVAEAEQKQTTSSIVAGILNIKQLNKYRTFLKLFLITILPIIMSFWVFNFGRTFWSWCGLFVWISLFLPIEAAIHAVYVATSLAELRQYTDPFNGLSLISQPSVLKWATETNAMASLFMLGIVGFSGLIMRICWPSIGQAVMSLGASDQIRQRFQAQSSAQALQLAQSRAVELETDYRTNQMLMRFERNGENPYNGLSSAIGKSMKQKQDGWSNQAFMGDGFNLFGSNSATPSNSYEALSMQRGGATQFSLQASQQAMAKVDASVRAAKGDIAQTARGFRESNGFAATDEQVKGFTDNFNRVSGLSKSDTGQQVLKDAHSYAYNEALKQGFSKEASYQIASRAVAGLSARAAEKVLSGGGAGGGIDFSGISTDSNGNKTDIGLSDEQRKSLTHMKEDSFAKAVQSYKQWQSSGQEQLSTSQKDAFKSDITHLYSNMKTSSTSLEKAQSAQTSLQKMMSIGGSKTVDGTKIISQMSKDDILQNRLPGGHVQKLAESNPNADTKAFQYAMNDDLDDSLRKQDYGATAFLLRAMGQDSMAELIDGGATISSRVDDASGGISSAPRLPGQSSGPFSNSPHTMFQNSAKGDSPIPLPAPAAKPASPPAPAAESGNLSQVSPEESARIRGRRDQARATSGFATTNAEQTTIANEEARQTLGSMRQRTVDVLASAMRGEISSSEAVEELSKIKESGSKAAAHLLENDPTFNQLINESGIKLPEGEKYKQSPFTQEEKNKLNSQIKELQKISEKSPSSLTNMHMVISNHILPIVDDGAKLAWGFIDPPGLKETTGQPLFVENPFK